MGAFRCFALSVAALGVAGCASRLDLPGYPLYADTGRRLTQNEVARLYGSIAWVDDRDVSTLGDALELLPGCHRVSTRDDLVPSLAGRLGRSWGGGVRFGRRSFVIAMRAGHTYVLERLASTAGTTVYIEEHDASGAWSRDIHPGTRGDAAVCETERLLPSSRAESASLPRVAHSLPPVADIKGAD
jgi:hypothetical protein